MWQRFAISPHLVWTSLDPSHMSHRTHIPLSISPSVPVHCLTRCLWVYKPLHFLKETQCSPSPFYLYFLCVGGSYEHSLSPCLIRKEKPSLPLCALCLSAISFKFCRLQRCVSAPRSSQEPNPCTWRKRHKLGSQGMREVQIVFLSGVSCATFGSLRLEQTMGSFLSRWLCAVP